jgi:Na+/H+ antiporter NhaD/arsenite permease-like protein
MVPMLISSAIVLVCLGLFFWEKVNRTIVAIFGALAIITAGRLMGFYSEKEAFAKIDLFTILLLMGMMILVVLLEPTGFFQYLGLLAGRLSKGKPVRLLILLGVISAVVSMFLDNITTVVLIAPITILICEILGIQARPFLMAEALFSNTGGAATLVGDPPNILIASAAGFSFNDFLVHSLPIVVVVWFVILFLMLHLFKKELSQPVKVDILNSVKPKEAIKDVPALVKVLVVLLFTVVGFFFQERLNVSPAYVAVAASTLAILLVGVNIKTTLKQVEWDVLLFFGSLFILIGGLEASGALSELALLLNGLENLPVIAVGVILLWLMAVLSAIIDNIPITIAMIPIVMELQTTGIDIHPLWWALVFGAGFGGNGTIIGATTNIVITSLSEKTDSPITPKYWNKRGLPVMLVSCATASLGYVILGLISGW